MVRIINRANPKPRSYTLREIIDKRKDLLIKRDVGGLGDILMHRMLFEDFKLLVPDIRITFACPQMYHPAVTDHPFIDRVVDCKTVSAEEFILQYNTSSVCARYELHTAPYGDKARPDIWAEHCGVNLTRHNMHIHISNQECEWAYEKLAELNPNNKPTVLLSPISAMLNKNLSLEQINPVIEKLNKCGYYVFVLHSLPTPQINAPCLYDINIRNWMSIINAVDYTISVDTAAFHCAGGLHKPVVGVFAWTDSKLYAKYYPKAVLVQKHRDYTPGWACGPCYDFSRCTMCPGETIRKPCITQITSDDIIAGFAEMVDRYNNATVS